MGLISGCRYLKVNLKANIYIYVNSTIQRCPNKIIKIFLIVDFFHLPPVSPTPVVNLELRISPRIFEKIRNGPNGILWGWGETDSLKTRSKKSWDTAPFYNFILCLCGFVNIKQCPPLIGCKKNQPQTSCFLNMLLQNF